MLSSTASLPLSQRGQARESGFTVKVEVSPWPNPGTVYYKCDGARFAAGDTTVKLCSGLNYQFQLIASPPLTCRSCKLSVDGTEAKDLKRLDADAAQHNGDQPEAQANGSSAAGQQQGAAVPQQQQVSQQPEANLIDLGDDSVAPPPSLPQQQHQPLQQPPPGQAGALPGSPFNLTGAHTQGSAAPPAAHHVNPFTAPPAAGEPHMTNPFTGPHHNPATNPFTAPAADPGHANPFLAPPQPAAVTGRHTQEPNPFLIPTPPMAPPAQHDNPFTGPVVEPVAGANPFLAPPADNPFLQPNTSCQPPADNPFLSEPIQDSNPFTDVLASQGSASMQHSASSQPQPQTSGLAQPTHSTATTPPQASFNQSVPLQSNGSSKQLAAQSSSHALAATADKPGPPSDHLVAGTRLPKLVSNPSDTAAQAKYSWGWTCEVAKSSKGDRRTLQLLMDTEELGLVELGMLIKVYKPTSKGRLNGMKLRWIQYGVVPHSQLDGRGAVVHSSVCSLP